MIPNPFAGHFFAFEGGDGCGKTVQIQKAKSWLRSLKLVRHRDIIETKEPGKDRLFGKQIYQDLYTPDGLHKTDPYRFQMWYACDSKEHMQELVVPALRMGSVVLTDRFRPSMVFGAQNEAEIPSLMCMNQKILGEHFIWPDAVFIFNIGVETAIERSKKKGRELDGHENRTVLSRVLRNYVHFSMCYPNCHLIDAERTPEEIFEDVKRIIAATLLIPKPKPV